jgi:hypothetical protein
LNRFAKLNPWLQALIAGTAYLLVMIGVHWFWAEFMLTPTARNAIFGQNYFPYPVPPSEYHLNWEFVKYDANRNAFLVGLLIAWVEVFLFSRIGLAFGNFLTRLRR